MWAQLVQPAPAVQWVSPYTHEDERSESGLYHSFAWDAQNERWSATPLPLGDQHYGEEQERGDSGEEWWFGHANYSEQGQVKGIITAGYGSWPNCYWKGEGCSRPISAELVTSESWAPSPDQFEQNDHRKGETRGIVALLNDEGEEIWYRHLLPGLLYNAVQDGDGNVLVAGVTYTNVWPDDLEPGDNPVIRYDADATTDMNAVDCGAFSGYFPGFGYVAKLDPDGHILWCTMLSAEHDPEDGWIGGGSILNDIAVLDDDGEQTYYVVGRSSMVSETTQPYLAKLSEDGILIDDIWCSPTVHPELPSGWPDQGFGWFLSIEKDPDSDAMVVAGVTEGTLGTHAIMGLLDPNGTDLAPEWFHTTSPLDDDVFEQGGYEDGLMNYSTGGAFVKNGLNTWVAWPVMANFIIPNIYAGRKAAYLKVHAFDLSGGYQWTTDLGKVAAYDLQSDLVATTDGNMAVVCSKWSGDFEFPDDPFRWLDLPLSARTCINALFNYDRDLIEPGEQTVDWENESFFDYWNTDAFVAKLDPSNGQMIWCTQWDADPTTDFDCWPGDIKNQECMYKITETPDGGLVVSGNTSHNFDDAYLAKLYPDCQSAVAYDPVIAAAVMATDDRSYTVGTNETWNTDKNIHGTIIIPDGHQLNISGNTTIAFADSRLLAHPTRIIVEAGGQLTVGTNVTLTSLPGCNGLKALWDGIIVQGDMDYPLQEPVYASAQGSVSLRTCVVENARVAISVGQDLLATNSMLEAQALSSGGIVTADGTTFRNNVRDVVFSPFENHHGDYPNGLYGIEENKSRFRTCTFENTAQLNDPYQRPEAHATLFGVRGVRFQGCTFTGGVYPLLDENDNTVLTDQYMGQGIKSLNSTFAVEARCQPQQYGDPCTEEELVRNTFTTLWYGVNASTFGDMSRTFIVDRSDFRGCVRGIRMEGIQDAGITLNTFEVGDLPVGDLAVTPYGVYSDQCTGYEIEENAFGIGSHSSALKKVGLVIKDSGKNYNTFYNNTFDALHVGSLIEGGNASADEITGLEIKCNDYGLTTKCDFDVALTGEAVKIQKTQGMPLVVQDPSTYMNPAGNRFSIGHNGSFHPEEDWLVEDDASTAPDYFHHIASTVDRTEPVYAEEPQDIVRLEQPFAWPGKETACPSHLIRRDREQNRMASEGANTDLEDSKDAYDATKDDGETYSLLSYVSDAGHSSAQVRDALQSTAPKVSAEVWNAAFDRDPAMSAWHITQALLSNSPLQGEVLKRAQDSGLPSFYMGLVAQAQTGEANILSLLESAVAYHAGEKAGALTDLGRSAFTDSLDMGDGIDSLQWWHEQLPADNHGHAVGAALAAREDLTGLYDLAHAFELADEEPDLYGVVKRYAGGWTEADATTLAWLADLGDQRYVQGSAQANAWREAMGEAAVEEIILLPLEERSMVASTSSSRGPIDWADELVLEVYPNPAKGPVYVVMHSPDTHGQNTLQVMGANGSVVHRSATPAGANVIELNTADWASGLYVIELSSDHMQPARVKLSVQR